MINMTELPLAPLKRILKEAGGTRISDEAVVELAKVLEEYGEEIGEIANKYARHAGRKTVKAEDIQMATR
jgi:histone H3/H4